jgi:hypothetical protein
MKRIQFVILMLLAASFASITTGSVSPFQKDKHEVAVFYDEFVQESTALDVEKIRDVYASLGQKLTGKAARDQMFRRYDTINPELFSKVYMTNSTEAEVGSSYANILLLSLAAGGEKVEASLPPQDAVTSYDDDKLGKKVYEINRNMIEVEVPKDLASKVTRSGRNSLSPVRIVKDGESWKVIADVNMLTEIGIPRTA